MRIFLLALVALLATAAPAAADPVKPDSLVFTVTCPGTAPFMIVGTGAAGHVLGSTGIAVLISGARTVFEDGVLVDQVTFTNPGKGIPTLAPCTAIAQLVAPDGVTVRFEITNAAILLTPPRR